MRIVRLIDLPIEWKRGNGLRKSDLVAEGDKRCVLYGELYTKHKNVLINSKELSRLDKTGSVLSKAGDVLVPGTSTASRKDMLLAREIDEDGVYLGGDINIIRPQKGIFAKKYLAYYFETLDAYNQLDRYITGSTGIIHISNTGLKNLEIPLPSLIEQEKIVAKLDEANSIIEEATKLTNKKLEYLSELKESIINGSFKDS